MEFEVLSSGYRLIEGPRVDERNRLYFSDVAAGGVYRRSPDGSVETLIPKRRGVGGIGLNEGGGLVASGRGLVYWDERTRQSRNVFTEFEGRPIVGLNDIQPDSHGSVYVGSLEFDVLGGGAPTPCSLFRVDPDGTVTKLWEGIEVTNGMGFSADGKLLYHCDSNTAVWVYDVMPDRTVKDRRVFAKLPVGSPDGMAVDGEGGIFVAAAWGGEVVRIKSDGTIDRRIKMPVKFITSLTFGGPDLQDLYVVSAEDQTGKGTIYRARSDIPGQPVPKTRFQ
jgi:D-xylonolactonase